MTAIEKRVKDIVDEVLQMHAQQIVIDLVQDEIEPLIGKREDVTGKVGGPTRDEVGAAAYMTDILLEVFNPKFEKDIDILKRLSSALTEWSNDIEATNVLLGLPKES